MTNLPNMRHAARECVDRAKHLLSLGDEPSVRSACLQLRFAVEYLTYSQVDAYRNDLPYDSIKKWQPKQVINEMRTIDPRADCTSVLSFSREANPSAPPVSEEGWQTLGEDRRFSKEWIDKYYHSLGNFLHAPTLHQLETGAAPTVEKILVKANEVLAECEKILSSSIFNVRFGGVWFKCSDCKTVTNTGIAGPNTKQEVRCRQCLAVYDIEIDAEQNIKGTLHRAYYTCPAPCETENSVGRHRIVEGAELTCKKCGKKSKVGLAILGGVLDVDMHLTKVLEN